MRGTCPGPPNCSYSFTTMHGHVNPNMRAYDAMVQAYMDIVDPTDMDKTQSPWTDFVYWMDDILTDVMGCVSRTDERCADDGYCLCQAAPGPIFCCPFGPNAHHDSSIEDHITSITGEKFDLWRLGWSTFLQVPLNAKMEETKLLIRGKVTRDPDADACSLSFLDEVEISGLWMAGRPAKFHVFVFF